jgi:hypothetical protein
MLNSSAQPQQLPEQAGQHLRQEQDEHIVPGMPEQVFVAQQPFAGRPGKDERGADIAQHHRRQAPGHLQPAAGLGGEHPGADPADQQGQAQYQPARATLAHSAAEQLQVEARHRHRDTDRDRQAEAEHFTAPQHGGSNTRP